MPDPQPDFRRADDLCRAKADENIPTFFLKFSSSCQELLPATLMPGTLTSHFASLYPHHVFYRFYSS